MALDIRDLYLRPNKDTGAIDNPECAFGYEASVHLTEAYGNAGIVEKPSQELPGQQQPTPEVDRGVDIQELTATLKVLGWTFVVLAILALIFK
jgi:hypothetical protein